MFLGSSNSHISSSHGCTGGASLGCSRAWVARFGARSAESSTPWSGAALVVSVMVGAAAQAWSAGFSILMAGSVGLEAAPTVAGIARPTVAGGG